MKNIHKTSLMTAGLSVLAIVSVFFIQSRGQRELANSCSYLDPVSIDILAFSAALFLVVEGLFKIYKNSDDEPLHQITRAVRIGFGLAIITIHIMQVVYK